MCEEQIRRSQEERFNLPVIISGNFSSLISDDMVKKLIVSLLNRKQITQSELCKYGIRESSIEKYGLENLVAGGYKKRSNSVYMRQGVLKVTNNGWIASQNLIYF